MHAGPVAGTLAAAAALTCVSIQQYQVLLLCGWPPVVWTDDVPHCPGMLRQGLSWEHAIVHTLQPADVTASSELSVLRQGRPTRLPGSTYRLFPDVPQPRLSWSSPLPQAAL